MDNDTTNVTGGPTLFFNFGTATVSVNGGAPVTFTNAIDVFSNQSVPAVGFEEAVDILDDSSASFATYALITSIGPITGTALFNPGSSFPTTGGAFILNSVGDLYRNDLGSAGTRVADAAGCGVRWPRSDPPSQKILTRSRCRFPTPPTGRRTARPWR